MSLADPAVIRRPACKLCGKAMFRDHRKTVIRADRTEMQVYACECGSRTTRLWKPPTGRKLAATAQQKRARSR